jgi:hypothetical protein
MLVLVFESGAAKPIDGAGDTPNRGVRDRLA